MSIGEYAFEGCTGLVSINVNEGNAKYTSIDGVLFNKAKSEIIQYPGNKVGAYTVPDSVTCIGKGAFFDCSGLTSVILPNSLTSIGEKAFQNCSGLVSVIIPNSVTSLGWFSFYKCSSLTSVALPSGVTSIGFCVFNSCVELSSITIPSGVTSIRNAFGFCPKLKSVTFLSAAPPDGYLEFDNSHTTLHVKTGCKTAYSSTCFGRVLCEIVEDAE